MEIGTFLLFLNSLAQVRGGNQSLILYLTSRYLTFPPLVKAEFQWYLVREDATLCYRPIGSTQTLNTLKVAHAKR